MKEQKLTKKKIISILLAIFVIAFIALAFDKSTNIFSLSSACHSNNIIISTQSSSGIFSQNEKDAYVIVNPHYYRPATGICAFPNGGTPLTVHDSLDLYKINIATGSVEMLDSILEEDWDDFIVGLGSQIINIRHKGDNVFYAYVDGQKKSDLFSKKLYLKADLARGNLEQLSSKEEYDNIVKNIPEIKGSFDEDSNGNWLDFQDGYNNPTLKLFNTSGSKIIVEGHDWLPYNFEVFN